MVKRIALATVLGLAACKDDAANNDDDGGPGSASASASATAGSDGGDTSGGDDGSTGEPMPPVDDPLDAVALLNRASLDLRGLRPSAEELAQVEADPAAVDGIIEGFVDDPAWAGRVKDIFAGAWRTRIDVYDAPDGGYGGEQPPAYHTAVGEEVLDLIAYVAMNDLPFREILQSPDTFVDPLLVSLWPLEQQAAGNEWLPPGTVRARYTDGRPQAGVLSLNAVYWRHPSTVENANRGRTNALSQALLCQSYLDRPIDFPTDLDLTDSESIRQAIREVGACQACHATLDPFASYLWGFMYPNEPSTTYSVAAERDWQIYTDTPPGFFGVPGERLVDLGQQIADDERFISCTVRRVYEGMLGRDAVLQDEGALAEHREAFLASSLSLKALVRSILHDPSYRGVHWEPRFGGTPAPVPLKVAPVEVWSRSLTELSGYALEFGGRDGTRLDAAVRTLAGGSDRGDATDVSTGAVLVQRRLAEAGATWLVDNQGSSGGRLDEVLAGVDLEAAPSDATLVALVQGARAKTLDTDDPELVALAQLWTDAAAIDDARGAWIALLTAILADPDHLLY